MPKGLKPGTQYCIICDQAPASGQPGFALTQNHLEDRLSIFHREDVEATGNMRYACSPAHVQELVIHWMITGNLDYPFAESATGLRPAVQSVAPLWEWNGNIPKALVPIGELAIDRVAVQRLLRENPAGLEVILEELHEALEKSIEDSLDTQTLADLPVSLLPHI